MTLRRAAIVSPLRTAVGKFGGGLSALTAGQLGATIIKALVERRGIDPERVDDVAFGHGYPSGEAPSIGRWSWQIGRPAVWERGGPDVEVPGVAGTLKK